MNKLKLFKRLSYRLILIIATIVFADLSVKKAIAHDHITVLFQPPPDNKQPEQTEGAASRQSGKCAANSLSSESALAQKPSFIALVPRRNYGLTTAQHPNFWIHLPKTSANRAILSIREGGSSPHWQQSVNLTGKAGITGIKLSQDAPALKIGKQYQWAVILVCGDRPSPNDPVVTAWIERIEHTKQLSQNISPNNSLEDLGLEEASAYARQGIWYDALNILLAQKPSLTNWNELWTKYLQSAGLETISNKPIVGNF